MTAFCHINTTGSNRSARIIGNGELIASCDVSSTGTFVGYGHSVLNGSEHINVYLNGLGHITFYLLNSMVSCRYMYCYIQIHIGIYICCSLSKVIISIGQSQRVSTADCSTDQFIPSTLNGLQSSFQHVIHSTHIRYRSSRN